MNGSKMVEVRIKHVEFAPPFERNLVDLSVVTRINIDTKTIHFKAWDIGMDVHPDDWDQFIATAKEYWQC